MGRWSNLQPKAEKLPSSFGRLVVGEDGAPFAEGVLEEVVLLPKDRHKLFASVVIVSDSSDMVEPE